MTSLEEDCEPVILTKLGGVITLASPVFAFHSLSWCSQINSILKCKSPREKKVLDHYVWTAKYERPAVM